MKSIQKVVPIFFFILIFAPPLVASSPDNEGSILTGQGELINLDLEHQSVVVEVPLNGRVYTVAGRLSPETLVRKNDLATDLSAFKVGDSVKIGWRKTQKGHHIALFEMAIRAEGQSLKGMHFFSSTHTVIGAPAYHIISKGETLLDIARQYGLGINEMRSLYPQFDPWILPEGKKLIIPTQWILPEAAKVGIVINVAEFRLFYFHKGYSRVKTYPLGLGEKEYATPVGLYKIGGKEINPTWDIPSSLQHKYKAQSMPPGPDNPLGKFWMRLGNTSYGIHGTDIPWSVGRLVTHGCIRMYPEDISQFFEMVMPGTPVNIIYEPVKIGFYSDRIFVEVHRDIYNKIEDFKAYAYQKLQDKNLMNRVNMSKFEKALVLRNGMPQDVTISN